MLKITVAALCMLISSFSIHAGYTVTWTAPTENTDGSPLTDLAGFELWCIPAMNTYGNPMIFNDPDQVRHDHAWASPPGDWKCKMKAFNDAGTRSADSAEVFWVCVDPDGDGNCQSESSVIHLEPEAPNIVVECPVNGIGCRRNEFTVTRKGYWIIQGPDGDVLQKPGGGPRQVTSRDEGYEWISKDGRSGVFILLPPTYEVTYE